MKTLNIKAQFETLAEAVNQSGIDLSYNKAQAMNDIKRDDRNVEKAYITEDGDVYFIYSCDIRVLNKYQPFGSCIDDSPFQLIELGDDTINFHECFYDKTIRNRKLIAKANVIVA